MSSSKHNRARKKTASRKTIRLSYAALQTLSSTDAAPLVSYSLALRKHAGGKPRGAKTAVLIEKLRELRLRNKPVWTLARVFWPTLSVREARSRLYVFISKHRREINA